jgi:hypothetical protein
VSDWVFIFSGYEVLWLLLGCALLGGLSGVAVSWLMPIGIAQRRGRRRGAHRPWWRRAKPSETPAPAAADAPAITVAIPVLDAETERIPAISMTKEGKT